MPRHPKHPSRSLLVCCSSPRQLEDIARRKRVGLLAGGSGLTPMLQVAEEALRQKLPIQVGGAGGAGSEVRQGHQLLATAAPLPEVAACSLRPPPQLNMIFANVSEADIIAKDRLGEAACGS